MRSTDILAPGGVLRPAGTRSALFAALAVLARLMPLAGTGAAFAGQQGEVSPLVIPPASPTRPEPSPGDLERFKAAVEALRTAAENRAIASAVETLAEGFPASRAVLVEAVERGPSRVRLFAVRVLGERGDADADLAVVAKCLRDQSPAVRRTAVLAVRALGRKGLDAILAFLPGEREPSVRKLAVKTLERWGNSEAIPPLTRLLKTEKDPHVAGFIVTALESLSGRRYGRDVEAWEVYARTWLESERSSAVRAYLREMQERRSE